MSNSRNSVIDIVRCVAAIEVMFSHLRGFIFDDYLNLAQPTIATKLFYYITGFGHEAVVIFFVLSGYLVGGSVLAAKQDGFWLRYSVQRLSRLWIVLLPCLVATLVWNSVGQHTGGSGYLSGNMNPPISCAPFAIPVHTDLWTFFGNLLFVQGIVTPVYGDNGPLWSLANEFWYYVLFPILFFGIGKRSNSPVLLRGFYLVAAAVIALLLPWKIMSGFFVWLFGVGAFAMSGWRRGSDFMRDSRFGILALAVCVAFLHLARVGRNNSDLLLGLAFAAAIPYLSHLLEPKKLLALLAAFLADFSYTLYLAHFPLAAFIWYTFFDAQRLEPSLVAVSRFCCEALILLGYSFLLSLIFERNTDKLRRYIMRLVSASFGVGDYNKRSSAIS